MRLEPLIKKMKSSPDISWNKKVELKYKGETVQGSNMVDLVNDVLRKRKYFNPEGWETFGEDLREANDRDCHGSGSVIVVDVQISSERLVV
jgi:hypothetical protein